MSLAVKENLTIAATSDWHMRFDGRLTPLFRPDQYKEVVEEISKKADVLLVCGDLLDHAEGKEEVTHGAKKIAKVFAASKIPVLGLLGNHEHDVGHPDLISKILKDEGGVTMLEGNTYTIGDIGFAGTKGHGGGLKPYTFPRYGESENKAYYDSMQIANNVLKDSLADLQTPTKIVGLHYSPIRETLVGESPEIYPFLGSSDLEDIIDSDGKVQFVFHGHAHFGSPEGRTQKGTLVNNVAIPVLQREQGLPKIFEPDSMYKKVIVPQPKSSMNSIKAA